MKSRVKKIQKSISSWFTKLISITKLKIRNFFGIIATNFKRADRLQRTAWSLAALLIVSSISYAVVDGVNQADVSSTDSIVASDKSKQDEDNKQDRLRLITGQAESAGDKILLSVGVHSQHQFKKIWANYSDDITELEKEPGRIKETIELGDRDKFDAYQVQISSSKVRKGRRYYYQAVGETKDGDILYGQIATFDSSS